MKAKSTKSKGGELAAEQTVKNIRRATRKIHSAEDKVRIVLDLSCAKKQFCQLIDVLPPGAPYPSALTKSHENGYIKSGCITEDGSRICKVLHT